MTDEEKAMTVEEAVEHITEPLADGFHVNDLWEILPAAMDLIEEIGGMEGAKKKERVLLIMEKVLDKFDLPGWDWLTKKAIMWFLPGAIDKLVDASNGAFSF